MSEQPGARDDLYISADLEADGPVPGRYSMLSFGLAVIGSLRQDGAFERQDPSEQTFYRELRPISDDFVQAAMEVHRLDRDRLAREGEEPAAAMTAAAEWVSSVAGPRRPVLVAYPLAFDWMFLQWYFLSFTGDSPFGHSSCLDIKTVLQQRTGAVLDVLRPDLLPADVRPTRPHTHNALDDAMQQGELLANVLAWAGGR